MNKEKQQIEEMAITICRKRHACILKDNESCRKCDQHERCLYQDIAYALYQEGYRKQSEGEWIGNRQTGEYICNLCGGIAPVDCEKEDFYKSNFCPNCGAKMKGE
jgi:hypothetical protein